MRPPIEDLKLCRNAARMTKDWDPLAPTGITADQARALRSTPRLAELHKMQKKLKTDILFTDGEKRAQLSQAQMKLTKEIKRVNQALRREADSRLRNEYFEEAPVLELEKQIKQQRLSATDDSEQINTMSNPCTPEYVFKERARIASVFWGPDAGTLTGEAALHQRVQVVKDLAMLCHLKEQRVPGKRVNHYESNRDSITIPSSPTESKSVDQKPESPSIPLHCPRTQCIVCFNELGPRLTHEFSRIATLRRHFEDQHTAKMAPTWKCEHPSCRGTDPLGSLKSFLYHAAKVHNYDIRIRVDRRGGRLHD